MTPDHLHVVLSTDQELSDEDILRYDAQHWSIECVFRQAKDQLKSGGPCSSRSGGETVLGRGAVRLCIQHRGISTRPLFRPRASSVSERAQRRRAHR
ncbi:hypothetical protein EP10_002973 [Geobacillus icigianus]|uniref:Transposase IS4-like domain-containing protein n=1 Tax=Geobacillus icigianus TaxID=1430331 RepID=A0ABU6BJB4_9BACL|nr:hypothetical protein [Geobacillus icigianus]